MGEDSWRLMTLCLLTTVVALLLVLSIHLHQDVKYWQVRRLAICSLRGAYNTALVFSKLHWSDF